MNLKPLFFIFIIIFLTSCSKNIINSKDSMTSVTENRFSIEELLLSDIEEPDEFQTTEVLPKEMLDDNIDIQFSKEEIDNFNTTLNNGPSYDIPLVMNSKVEKMIHYFQTTCHKTFALWLSRSGKYIPVMQQILREYGLPQDLIYVALIESGFNPKAYSRSHASGIWQFISATGRRYGLKNNWWHDQRRDPILACHAAAKYFKDLYDEFNDWHLAMAAYNAGEGKIRRGLKRYKAKDFWELSKYRYLKRETKQYVPKILAAMVIAREPEKYGFKNIEYQQPLIYDEILVPECTDIRQIAKITDISYEEIKNLNPSLRRWCTPPKIDSYSIKLPSGKGKILANQIDKLKKAPKIVFKRHYVRQGQTLSSISKQHKTSVWAIMDLNHIKSAKRLRAGKVILIPIPNYPMEKEALASAISKTPAYNSKASKHIPGNKKETYKIRRGDNLWSIANRYNISIENIMIANNLSSTVLRPGNVLKIPAKGAKSQNQSIITANNTPADKSYKKSLNKKKGLSTLTYKVRHGDTLWDIAQQYGVTVSELKRWNSLNSRGEIYPGDMLTLQVIF